MLLIHLDEVVRVCVGSKESTTLILCAPLCADVGLFLGLVSIAKRFQPSRFVFGFVQHAPGFFGYAER